jgi:hypothetical protein
VFSHAKFDILAAVFKVVTSSRVKKFTVVSERPSSFFLSQGIIVKLETEIFFETSVNFYRKIKRHIPDDSNHH